MKKIYGYVLAGLMLVGPAMAQQSELLIAGNDRQVVSPTSPEARLQRAELLLSHGINTDAPSMILFLEKGFNEEGLPQGLPKYPLLKSEVVNAAIEELGIQRAGGAVTVLSQIARKEMPETVRRIVRRDFESVPIETMDRQVRLMENVLALNAVVALGLIGDEAGREAVLKAMRDNQPTGFITQGAIALAQMGSNEGLDPVVRLAQDIESPDSQAAFTTVYVLTGRNYGYTENTSLARRRQLLGMLNEWYAGEGSRFVVSRVDVMRRLKVPIADAVLEADSLRGLLRNDMNVTNYDQRYYARQRLMELAPHSFEELRSIVEDPMEDLDIRRTAMRWLVISDPDKSKKYVKRQRDDENRVIREFAREILKDIPRYEEELAKRE